MSDLDLFTARWRELRTKPWLLPDEALVYFLAKLAHHTRLRIDSFGWLQAILYSWRIDQWQRYAAVAQQIKALNQQSISILDVGGGSGAIKEFLSPEEYRLCILDINAEALRRVSDSKLEVIAGDGCRLPFRDNSFDVVLSVDSLEHVPDAKKADYCHELKRVTRRCVIIHCPADSSDGRFKGTAYDTKFLRWYKQRFKKDETNTAEHIRLGLPRVEELMRLFPRVAIAGKQNTWVWLRYMRWGYTPYVRLVVGLLYKLCLISKDNLPPCHACLLVWKKE